MEVTVLLMRWRKQAGMLVGCAEVDTRRNRRDAGFREKGQSYTTSDRVTGTQWHI